MKNGNYTFRYWLFVCRLCVALFGVVGVANAQTITSSYSSKTITTTFLDKTLNPDGTWTFRLSWSWVNTGSHGLGSGHVQVNGTDRVYVMNGNESGTWVNPAIPGTTASVTIRTKIDYYGDYDVKTFSITKPTEVMLPKKVHLGLTNPSETQEMIYRIYQDGNLIEEVTVPPRMSMGAVIEVPENSQIEVFSLVKGLIKEGPNWIEDPGAVTELGQVGAVSGDPITPTTVDPPPAVPIKPPENVPIAGSQPDKEKPLWKSTPDTVDTERLDKSTYREGVDKLWAKLRDVESAALASRVDLSGVESRIDTTNQRLEKLPGHLDATKDKADVAQSTLDDWADGSSKASAAVSAGTSAAGQAKTAVEGAMGGLAPTASGNLPGAPGGPPSGSHELKANASTTLHLLKNPFSSDGPFGGVMGVVAGIVRRLIAWGLVCAFMVWCFNSIRGMVQAPFNVAPFGSSITDSINSIKVLGSGGGLGYAAKLVAYAAVLVILLTLPPAIMATVTVGLPWSDFGSVIAAGPIGSLGGKAGEAVSLANQVVPWAMLLSMPAYYFFVEFVLFPSQVFWAFFIKFMPL